jgi:hypothetical protein
MDTLSFRERLAAFQNGQTIQEMTESVSSDKFVILENGMDVWPYIKKATSILFVKPVQSGKTSDVYKILEELYRTHIVIMVSDKNKALAGQTNSRGKVGGWSIKNFSEINSIMDCYSWAMKSGEDCKKGKGKKVISHFLMEINNVTILSQLIAILPKDIPTVLIVDEGDKNRNTDGADTSDDEDDEDEDTVSIPPVTAGLLFCKNLLMDKNNGSKCVYVTATPLGIMCSEKDDERLVIYKRPYDNYTGVGLDHDHHIELVQSMVSNNCLTRVKWTGSTVDRMTNTYYSGVIQAVDRFEKMGSKDESIKQVMLISLENHTRPQDRLEIVVNNLIRPEYKDDIEVVVFNSAPKNKIKGMDLLSQRICMSPKKKVIVISGFKASRGVSFTDFNSEDGTFELVVQVHAAKMKDPLNSSMQAMRIFGPARRTVSRPVLFCNEITYKEVTHNFKESYRVVRDLAMGKKTVYQDKFDARRPMTQKFNFRYMKQGYANGVLLFESFDQKDHERIMSM